MFFLFKYKILLSYLKVLGSKDLELMYLEF